MQAITEFFPVSSSAHLSLAKSFLGISSDNVLLELACHAGTLFALIYFLKEDILEILFCAPKKFLLFFLALLPLPPLYLLFKPVQKIFAEGSFLGPSLALTGGILLAGQFFSMQRSGKREGRRKSRDALLIGAAQSIALIPGISRSASTISCARVLGWNAKEAVRFSFLLSIPTVLGGNCLELIRVSATKTEALSLPWGALFAAFVSSFVVGMLIVKRAISWLEKGDLRRCGWYCIALGIFVTVYFNT